uniref:uncharacterized protein K02A2.6-like n=1 Tax=Styela clava TaxID=7725 RepID=UPI00193A17B3|nr:uncharacterized protein K02A2.6-like [Styela clava]
MCPARGKRCSKCGRMGHFKVRCGKLRGKPARQQGHNEQCRNQPRINKNGKRLNDTNCVDCSNDENSEFTFTVRDHNSYHDGIITLNVGGVNLSNVIIDSGACRNFMGSNTWEWLKSERIVCNSRKCSIPSLYAYGSTKPLQVLGTFTANVFVLNNESKCRTDFVVVKGNCQTLLGKEAATKLNVLRVGPVNAVSSKTIDTSNCDIFSKYGKLFEGIGLLKDYKLTLNIDKTVKPIAQPLRRIPYALRDKVDAKIDEMLKADIIEKAPEGPSTWISPLTVDHKKDGDIRICVDMRRANQAILRERQPIPTVEDLLHDLSGSAVFSKLDLKWGFHQILLDEKCRYITTFVINNGIFRYKRLMFGLSSAPEKYQQIIRDVVKNCRGVANIADDIIIHGRNVKEHDERLFDVLDKLDKAGLTLNAYFRSDCRTRIIADASPTGLGSALTQLQDGIWRVISYASRTMSDVERRCSQTEKEALAIVWACERFNLYIFGRKFELETDHKPLECIYSKTSKPSARIERWVLRLQAYDFKILRKRVLELAHEGHQGIVKTKNRLRSKVWWPNIDRDAERKCKVCHGCRVTSSYSPPEPMTRTRPPSGPWIDCCADVLGPLPSGDNILVIVDYYSRFYEIVIVRSTTSKKIIEALSTIFSRYGIPLTLRTDNAPQLVSNEFKSFLDEHGVQHKSTTPLWPQANGEVETAQVEGKDWKSELNKFLLAYRSTPHTATGV